MITNSLFYNVFFFSLSSGGGGGGELYCHSLGGDQRPASSLLDVRKSTQPEVAMTSLSCIISEFLGSFFHGS